MSVDRIEVRGAKEHNLQNVDLTLPRDQLVVITGVSGSGKSSLAFDTIYAEGQRRYVESLSAYARQFLDQQNKPDVESIEGLSPAISIEQKTTSNNPRSTVGTVTELYDYLRLLYARIGKPACPKCGQPVTRQTVQQIVDRIIDRGPRTKVIVMAPIVRARKGEYRKELDQLRKDGFTRVRLDGELRELSESITMDKRKKHDLDVIIDRVVIKEGIRQRLTDSVELGLRLGEGLLRVEYPGVPEEELLSQKIACLDCGVSLPDIEPRTFSFNSPQGACVTCSGLGELSYFDPELLVPNPEQSLIEGVLAPWPNSTWYTPVLEALCKHYGKSMKTPWKKLPKSFQKIVMEGSGEQAIKIVYKGDGHQYTYQKPFEGLIPWLERRMTETASENVRDGLGEYTNLHACPDCEGARLKPEARVVKVAERSIHEITRLSIRDAASFFDEMQLDHRDSQVAERVLREVHERLGFLNRVGLGYLSLDRRAGTLSGGESQRIRLATQIGRSLVGVLYILDEPSIGLHQRDNERLLQTLVKLRDIGNTVLVVEHDEDTIRAADWVVDMGPGAGRHGGTVVAEGTPKQIEKHKASLTGQYLRGVQGIEVPQERRTARPESLVVHGAAGNNLKGLDVEFPLGVLTCVTGVSGSGKSTLVNQTLRRALGRSLHGAKDKPAKHTKIEGLDLVDKVINIDQSPIGRTPRSNPATYAQVFGDVRDLFASLPEAKVRGYKAGRFSFNVKGGRCESCQGDGIIRIEMHFLPDIFVTCETCGGRRYNRETLEIHYKGYSIADILDMTVSEALEVLGNIPSIARKLSTLKDVGLGYIHLGQQATTLSGGEAQRVKLAKELARRSTGKTLYILDEPTTGLHFHDIKKLLEVLHRLVEQGNTVVVIEHNLDVIKTADWVIDLGPEGGDGGGLVIAEGTPEQVVQVKESYTGAFLKKLLGPGAAQPAARPAAPAKKKARATKASKRTKAAPRKKTVGARRKTKATSGA